MRLYVGATVAVLVLLALGNAKNDSDTSEVYNHFQDVHIAFQGLLCMCADKCKSDDGIEKVCSTKLILEKSISVKVVFFFFSSTNVLKTVSRLRWDPPTLGRTRPEPSGR